MKEELLKDFNEAIQRIVDRVLGFVKTDRQILDSAIRDALLGMRKPNYAATYFSHNYDYHAGNRVPIGQLVSYAKRENANFIANLVEFQERYLSMTDGNGSVIWPIQEVMTEHYYLDISGWLYSPEGCLGNVLVQDVDSLLVQDQDENLDIAVAIDVLSRDVIDSGNEAENRLFGRFMRERKKRRDNN